jgi:hypothetical protein
VNEAQILKEYELSAYLVPDSGLSDRANVPREGESKK